MTPAEYVREIVIPTVEEFRDDRTSRHRAYLAAIVTFQVKDYLAKAGEKGIEDTMRAAVPDEGFDVVRGVCNGSKHMRTDKTHVVAFLAGSDYERPPARAGLAQAGLSRAGDGAGGREILHGAVRMDLYRAIQTTLVAFIACYPAHLGDCLFKPYPNGI